MRHTGKLLYPQNLHMNVWNILLLPSSIAAPLFDLDLIIRTAKNDVMTSKHWLPFKMQTLDRFSCSKNLNS